MQKAAFLFLVFLLLLTACAQQSPSLPEEPSQERRAEESGLSEASAQEEAPEPAEESAPESTSGPTAWYVPLDTVPDFETYFASERYVRRDETYINCRERASLFRDDPDYRYFIGEYVSPTLYKEFDGLADHNFYRQKKGGKTEKELMAEGDFCDLVITPSWIYLWDTDNVCWRMPYPDGELEKLCEFEGERNLFPLGNAGCLTPCDNELMLVFTTLEGVYAIYTPTGEVYRMGPLCHSTSWLLPLTNRSYLVHLTMPTEEETVNGFYIYSGTEGKAYEVDYRSLGLQVIREEDVPLLFPLDGNGIPLLGPHLREVSLEEAGLAPAGDGEQH